MTLEQYTFSYWEASRICHIVRRTNAAHGTDYIDQESVDALGDIWEANPSPLLSLVAGEALAMVYEAENPAELAVS